MAATIASTAQGEVILAERSFGTPCWAARAWGSTLSVLAPARGGWRLGGSATGEDRSAVGTPECVGKQRLPRSGRERSSNDAEGDERERDREDEDRAPPIVAARVEAQPPRGRRRHEEQQPGAATRSL